MLVNYTTTKSNYSKLYISLYMEWQGWVGRVANAEDEDQPRSGGIQKSDVCQTARFPNRFHVHVCHTIIFITFIWFSITLIPNFVPFVSCRLIVQVLNIYYSKSNPTLNYILPCLSENDLDSLCKK